MIKFKFLSILALLCITASSAWGQSLPTDGSGAYTIGSKANWETFCTDVNNGTTYSGKTVKLTADITDAVTTMAGTYSDKFSGTFDGQGHTLTVNINTTDRYAAPFLFVNGATIRNLKTAGSVTSTTMDIAGIAANTIGNTTIENCASSVALSSSKDSDVDAGGIVSVVDENQTINVLGCSFTGSITYSNASGYEGAGIVGWLRSGATANISNCLFAPTAINITKWDVYCMFAAGVSNATISNCYYNDIAAGKTSITVQGKQARTISAANSDVTISGLGAATATYNVSAITAYSTGIKYNGTYYAGNGDNVSLTLSHAGKVGYTFSQYTATPGTLSAQTETSATLTMTDAEQTVSAQYTAIAVTGVSLNKTSTSIALGGSETLTATVSPTNALNKTVAWTSSNSAVATVADGTVTAVNAGTCTVTATTADGDFKATCTVTVTDPSALTKTGTNEWTLAAMPAYDIELSAEYYTDLLENNDGTWLASNNGQVADLWLGRTLQPGSYNTLALPFSMTIADFKAATGDNAILVKQLTAASVTGTTLNLTFGDAESITANTPYLVKLSGTESVKLEGFDLVTVSTADGTASFTDVSFIPTLSRTQVAGNVKNILFLGANNELLNPSAANQYIKGFRAYFLLKGEAAAAARSFVLDFGDGEMTGIQTIRTSDQSADQQQGTYDLQGRRINGQPTQKGIYIVNGKKTIIK